MSAVDVPLLISWFPTATPNGPAIGDPENTTWGAFHDVFWWRRVGEKDGPNFIPARFKLEPDGSHVRRLKANVVARTAIVLDCETNKLTGEVPPPPSEVQRRLEARAWLALVYTSHSHAPTAPRYRVVLPISEEIDPTFPAVEIVADHLDLFGVLDTSKIGASSLFYLPSCPDEDIMDLHEVILCRGGVICAGWINYCSACIQEQARIAADAHHAAAARRQERIAAGVDPDGSLIERIRQRLDLASILTAHGYAKHGKKFRHSNSSSGSFGADIKVLGGIERIFSHNGTDPLHRDNLPSWCGDVTALDAFDVVAILDYGGDRHRALLGLAERFGISKIAEKRAVAKLIFRMVRGDAPQAAIEASAFAAGLGHGLTRDEVIRVAQWVASQCAPHREAAA